MTLPPKTRFLTDDGLEVPAVTAEKMRELDRIAVEETGPNLFQMMENAGRTLAELAITSLASDWQDARFVVLAGSGGNGGGGICAARHLANRGAEVLLAITAPDRLREVPSVQLQVFRSTAGTEIEPHELPTGGVDLIIDALIGYSLRGAPRGVAATMIQWANRAGAPIISLDVPSGVDSTSGDVPGERVRPTATMTLALPKTGLSAELTGDLYLADIGIPEESFSRLGIPYTSPFGNRFMVPLRTG